MGIFGPGPAPMACCPYDGAPLMSTFERPKKEFHCMICGRWLEFLQPTRGDAATLQERHDELRVRFDAGERGPITEEVDR